MAFEVNHPGRIELSPPKFQRLLVTRNLSHQAQYLPLIVISRLAWPLLAPYAGLISRGGDGRIHVIGVVDHGDRSSLPDLHAKVSLDLLFWQQLAHPVKQPLGYH